MADLTLMPGAAYQSTAQSTIEYVSANKTDPESTSVGASQDQNRNVRSGLLMGPHVRIFREFLDV